MNEYIGIFDLPQVEYRACKIIANNWSEAYDKFCKYITDKNEDNIRYTDGDFIMILPLFDIEVI